MVGAPKHSTEDHKCYWAFMVNLHLILTAVRRCNLDFLFLGFAYWRQMWHLLAVDLRLL